MRPALIVSAVVHLVILAAAVVSLPRSPYETKPLVALPIELLTQAEATEILSGRVDAKAAEEVSAPEEVVRETPPEPAPQPGANDRVDDEIAVNADARSTGALSTGPRPEAASEPTPEAPDPEPEAEVPAEPELPPEETEVAAAEAPPADPFETPPEPAVEQPSPEEEAAEQPVEPRPQRQAQTPARVPETVVPTRRPRPPPRREAPRRTEVARTERAPDPDAFDADRMAALISRTDSAGGGSGAARTRIGVSEGNPNAAQTVSLGDSIRQQIYQCWYRPAGMRDEDNVVFRLRIELSTDGTVMLVDPPMLAGSESRFFDVAAETAIRAVRQCAPYRLPAEQYDQWREVEITFDTRLDARSGIGGPY